MNDVLLSVLCSTLITTTVTTVVVIGMHVCKKSVKIIYICPIIASPNLNPEVVYSCPGEIVTFTCMVTNGDRLSWEVDIIDSSQSDINRRRFSTDDHPGHEISARTNQGHKFLFTLISISPLTSNATTTMASYLGGTKVHCRNAAMARATSVIHVIDSK